MKKGIIVLALGVVAIATAAAEQITTVGIVDPVRIYTTFYRESQAVRELESLAQEYRSEVSGHIAELEGLQRQREAALRRDDENQADSLAQSIADLSRFINDLQQRRQSQLDARRQQLMTDQFIRQMNNSLQVIARREGFTIVIDARTDGILWFAPVIDITDKVLQHLRETAR